MKRFEVRSFKRLAFNLLRILLGTLIAAASFRYLTYPNGIVSGGITGVAQILNLLLNTPVGMTVIVFNIPLFLLAWKKLGRSFVLISLFAMLANSLFIDLLELFPFHVTSDPLLAAVYGGVMNGTGWGLVYITGATGGGIDIPARLIRRKYPHINFSMIQLCINAVIIVSFAVIFRKFESSMYTIICMFISAKVVDTVAYGPVNARLCYIISGKNAELEEAIFSHLGHGVTRLHGEGAWSKKEREVIMCVIRRQQIAELRKLVQNIDPHAFTIISDARGVYGKGFDNIAKED